MTDNRLYSVAFALYSTLLLALFANTGKYYPPCRRAANVSTNTTVNTSANAPSCAPPGIEGFNLLGLGFLFILILGVHLCYKSSNRRNCDLPIRAVGIFTSYFVGATIAARRGIWPYSWASVSIVTTQAILLGTIFEIANRPTPTDLQFKSDSELQFYIENHRQFARILLTVSIALGIGLFLQTYSREYLNSRHLVSVLGPLAFGLGLALELIRRRITEIGAFLGDEVTQVGS